MIVAAAIGLASCTAYVADPYAYPHAHHTTTYTTYDDGDAWPEQHWMHVHHHRVVPYHPYHHHDVVIHTGDKHRHSHSSSTHYGSTYKKVVDKNSGTHFRPVN